MTSEKRKAQYRKASAKNRAKKKILTDRFNELLITIKALIKEIENYKG